MRSTQTAAGTHHNLAATAVLILLFWLAAVAAVAVAHAGLDPVSPAGGAVATIGSIVLAAFCYTRLCARQAGTTHALGVGIAWLVLGIVTELAVTMHRGHAWYAILGSPDQPLLRNIVFFVWIFSPAVFAERSDQR